jgi:hypothetical protein
LIFREYHPAINLNLTEITERGIASGCPFCFARKNKSINVGDEVVLLTGYSSGKHYRVTDSKEKLTGNLLWEEMCEKPNGFLSISPYQHLWLKVPLPPIPSWALSLSVEDNCLIDDVLMRVASLSPELLTSDLDIKKIERIAAFFWAHRIPFDTAEMTKFLEAHGLLSTLHQNMSLVLDVARQTLQGAVGKAPIKRRKMPAFSKFRYLPNYKAI